MRLRAILAACACATVTAGVAQGASGPRLMLVDRAPVALLGTGFAARERVLLTVRAPSLVITRTVRAGDGGRFRTTIPTLRLVGRLRCAQGVMIVARRARGQLLLWRPPRLPDCAAPLPVRPA